MRPYPTSVVVVGLQHGDEGKGKITKALIEDPDRFGFRFTHCVRYSGGPNAGHTMYVAGKKVVTHVVPSGIVVGLPAVIGPGCVLSEAGLWGEIAELEAALPHLDIRGLIKISPRAHVILPEHVRDDEANDQIGSTKRGIAPVYSAKMLRTGTRAEAIPSFAPLLWPSERLDDPAHVLLFEGAQGFMLDPDWGDYPYVTSSSSLPGAINSVGVPVQSLQAVFGVAKAYETYVGAKGFEPADPVFDRLRTLGGEFGATTGRPRQCNWLNLARLALAARICGCATVVINKIDIIEQLGQFATVDDVGAVTRYPDRRAFEAAVTAALRARLPDVSVIFSGDPAKL